jgi:putative oxygen-independent coproporphyrinogen III oxidase
MTESLGIYVQVPFCSSKCSFCNFSSRVGGRDELQRYSEALRAEIQDLPGFYSRSGFANRLSSLPVDTIYFGGGTPTLLGSDRLQGLIEGLEQSFELRSPLEFTVETTPGSADDDLLRRLRQLSVNRLSIGAQSFNDAELRAVGRLHSADDTLSLVKRARDAGFSNISLDLIAGLPLQTEDSWRASLRSAIALEPEHISVYLFEVDEKSRLGAEVIQHGQRYSAGSVPSEDFMAWAYEHAREALTSEGYAQYEISNFARPGYESAHNRKYWRLEPYLGLGAGAHSFDGERRWANITDPELYSQKLRQGDSPIVNLRSLSREEQIEEFFFLGLRQRCGVDLQAGEERWGADHLAQWTPVIQELLEEGWIDRRGNHIRLLERAYLISNEIFARLLV